ncbi:MAG: beta-lactamase family protein [Candidatus Pacebacteria bacterium]|jgi:CubicO group peptidase (beta-lactamase class C family)|nr:beta-lactamase family protein [Candidatus Paceibacterota bacterium]
MLKAKPLYSASEIQSSIKERMRLYRVPGVSISFMDNGKQTDVVYGFANLNKKEKMTASHIFQAASISKPITALGIVMLHNSQLIDIYQPVNTYLRSWKLKTKKGTLSEATIIELLSHSAGISIDGFSGYEQGKKLPKEITTILDGTYPSNTPTIIENFKRGEFLYSGGGFTVLQKLVEEVTGKNFCDFMMKAVLIPFGMKNSFYSRDAVRRKKIATGYWSETDPVARGYHLYPELAAAGLWTNPSDLMMLIKTINKLLKKKSLNIDLLFKPIKKARRDAVGLGFFLNMVGKEVVAGHDGANAGFRSKFRFIVGKNKAIAVMTNSDEGFRFIDEIVSASDKRFAKTIE